MPRTVETTVYQYDELSDKAKERAREWYREASAGDSDFADFVIEDAVRMGELLGITFDTHAVKLIGGSTRYDSNVWWSLGYSQNDFVAFDGSYEFKVGAVEKILEETSGSDQKLLSIARRLDGLQSQFNGRLTARMKHHHYYGLQIETDAMDADDESMDISKEQDEELRDIMRDYCRWIYTRIREEYEYQNSDEQVEETIRANEYEFDEEGKRA